MPKKVKNVIQIGNPILRQKAKSVFKIGPKEKAITLKMRQILKETQGIGLAAPQIGKSLKIILVGTENKKDQKELGLKFYVLINPKIISKSKETEPLEEGCLSFQKPEIRGLVERSIKTEVKALDENGKKITLKAKNMLARSILHEIDHLNGILFTDRAIPRSIHEVKPSEKAKRKKIMESVKFYFLSSSQFGAEVLKNLKPDLLKKITLITFKDRPAGRGLELKANPAKIEAQKLNLKIKEIEGKNDAIKLLAKTNYDLAIVAGIALILPPETLICPKNKLKNIGLHPSLLPDLRGSSPIQTAILKGKNETGISLFQLEKKIDAGKIIIQRKLPIKNIDTAKVLEEKLARLGAEVLNLNIKFYLQKRLLAQPQKGKVTETHLFKKEEGNMTKNSAKEIWQKFKAFCTWPGVYFKINGKIIKITDLELKEGKISIKKVIPEGKKEMTFKQFLTGYELPLDLKNKIVYPS